jgi:hypothetical protein
VDVAVDVAGAAGACGRKRSARKVQPISTSEDSKTASTMFLVSGD